MRAAGISGIMEGTTPDGQTPGSLGFATAGWTPAERETIFRVWIDSYGGTTIGKNVRNASASAQLEVKGDIKTTHCTGCADIAENYQSGQNLAAGELVSINPAADGQIQRSQSAYDSKVLGVISSTPAI